MINAAKICLSYYLHLKSHQRGRTLGTCIPLFVSEVGVLVVGALLALGWTVVVGLYLSCPLVWKSSEAPIEKEIIKYWSKSTYRKTYWIVRLLNKHLSDQGLENRLGVLGVVHGY